jgi:ABC-type transport system involved in cytochrome bd biosynthesis fused ATPase/permease subunit
VSLFKQFQYLTPFNRRQKWRYGGLLASLTLIHIFSYASFAWSGAFLLENSSRRLAVMDAGSRLRSLDFLASSPWKIALFGLSSALLHALASTAATALSEHLKTTWISSVRPRVLHAWLMRHILQMTRQHDHGPSEPTPSAWAPARGITHVVDDVDHVQRALWHALPNQLRAGVTLLVLATAALITNPRFCGVALVVSLPLLLGQRALRAAVAQAVRKSEQSRQEGKLQIDGLLRAGDVFAVFGEIERASAIVRTNTHANASRSAFAALVSHVSTVSNEVAGAALVLIIVLLHQGRWFGSESWVQPVALLLIAYRPLRAWSDARMVLAETRAAIDRVYATLSAPLVVMPVRLQTTTTLKLVDFCASYTFSENDGHGVSGLARPGELIAITGPVGSGKSSLFRALLGLESAHGNAFFGELQLRHLPIGQARPFSWAPQEVVVFDGSIRDNLFACEGAIEHAELLSSIGASDTRIGPLSRSLSGGELRLLALARAFASSAPVVLLDEPSTHLDTPGRAKLFELLRAARGHRIILVATHDTELASLCDQQWAISRANS